MNKITNETWVYEQNETGVVVYGYNKEDDEHIVIPETIEEKPVEVLYFGVVSNETKTISIPKTVKEIKMWGYPISLEKILVDENNEQFCSKDGVLYSKDGTTLVRFPCAKKYDNKFLDGVVEIADFAFEDVQKIEDVIIPDTVVSIGEEAFCWCETLTSIKMTSSVKHIGAGAFCGCGLVELEMTKNISKYEMAEYDEGLGFFSCNDFEEFVVPENIEEIGDQTFDHCTKLKKVYIPASVNTIGKYVFSECCSLVEINVSENNENYYSIDGVLFSKDGTLLHYPQNKKSTFYEVPSDTKRIGEYAFYENKNLKHLKLNNNIVAFGYRAFASSNIESINIPHGVKTIGKDVFLYTSIKELYIPRTIEFIEMNSGTAGNINPYKDMIIIVDKNSYAEKICNECKLKVLLNDEKQ